MRGSGGVVAMMVGGGQVVQMVRWWSGGGGQMVRWWSGGGGQVVAAAQWHGTWQVMKGEGGWVGLMGEHGPMAWYVAGDER
jgi:hypothetical protein